MKLLFKYEIKVYSQTKDGRERIYPEFASDDLNDICKRFEDWYFQRVARNSKQIVKCYVDNEIVFDGTLGELVKKCLEISIAF